MNIHPIVSMFTDEKVTEIKKHYSSHGEEDHRCTLFLRLISGRRFIIKLAANSFSTPERLDMWRRCCETYRENGYYCPQILPALSGDFPYVSFENRRCCVWGEEFALYPTAENFDKEKISKNGYYTFIDDAILMNAKIASQHYDYTALPSAYCLFERFCDDDEECEVFENAHRWKAIADALPPQFAPQTERIWQRWQRDCEELKKVYHLLPRSVFQADINYTNCLLDKEGRFVGVFDFNIAGRDVFLNYLFREVPFVMTLPDYEPKEDEDYTVSCILHAIKVSKSVYTFSEAEKEYAGLLFRCLKPVWFYYELEEAKDDTQKTAMLLDSYEYMQTRHIDFRSAME